jgi:sigma-B regulation protein RsbU (phosphoserine phosphatase)
MREKAYLSGVLLGAGLLLYLGRDLLTRSALLTWGLSFAGTTAVGILAMALYRVLAELRASRHELARKEAELNFALEVQQALFPRKFPAKGGLEFAAVCLPARGISGDYYDVLPLSDGRVAFAVADISGKGISAAILMSNLHAVLRTLARTVQMPGQLCSQLNRHLYEVTQPAAKYATLFYGEWNGADRQLSYVNAGHPLPILLGSGRGRRLDRGGPPLGLFLDSEYQVGTVPLQPGDTIVVYSDGVTEAETPEGESFGEARLETLVAAHYEKPLAEIQRVALVAARDWSGKEIVDDMTLLLARITGPGKEVQ